MELFKKIFSCLFDICKKKLSKTWIKKIIIQDDFLYQFVETNRKKKDNKAIVKTNIKKREILEICEPLTRDEFLK